jgi:uncharacterized protein
VLGVLMLRGPQTLGELKSRSERLHRFGSLDEVATTLTRLSDRELVARLPRRPGQKEERYAHLLGPGGEAAPEAAAGETADADGRLEQLEQRVARLEEQLDEVLQRVRA